MEGKVGEKAGVHIEKKLALKPHLEKIRNAAHAYLANHKVQSQRGECCACTEPFSLNQMAHEDGCLSTFSEEEAGDASDGIEAFNIATLYVSSLQEIGIHLKELKVSKISFLCINILNG